MSILKGVTPTVRSSRILTIYGPAGTGKSSLASTFEGAFLIRTTGEIMPDDAASSPDSLGATETSESLYAQLTALITDEHDYKTLIIDSVTGLESMFVDEVVKGDPKAKTISQALGGYGAGRDAVAAMHERVRKAAELLRTRRKMHVVFLAHADVHSVTPPDSEGYNIYSLRLHAKSASPYIDKSDLVGFLRQKVLITSGEDDRNRAKTTGDIELVVVNTPAFVSKNRMGITSNLKVQLGVNPLEQYL